MPTTPNPSTNAKHCQSPGNIHRRLKKIEYKNHMMEYDVAEIHLQNIRMQKDTDQLKSKVQELMKTLGLTSEQDESMSFDGDLSSISIDIDSLNQTLEDVKEKALDTSIMLDSDSTPRKEAPSSALKRPSQGAFGTPRTSDAPVPGSSAKSVRFRLPFDCKEAQARTLKLASLPEGIEDQTTSVTESWCAGSPPSSPLARKS
ncbi:hypothetical protein EIP86_008439 [Pleurotus ostreatoroseus]|nr:hypothetical protein EIP86_008439 [Pleurotus ostreatoroseus]